MPTVLIVDDDDAVRDLVEMVLSDEGYQVYSAENGHSALLLLNMVRPDVVLLDVNMPRLDGLSTCRILRDDPRTAQLPVIAMSARPIGQTQLRNSQVDRFLPKPFDIDQLIDEVASYAGPPAAPDNLGS